MSGHDLPLEGIGKCPRCEAEIINRESSPISRITRDLDGAAVAICQHCSRAELFHPVDLMEWPLSIEDLVAESRVRLTTDRETMLSTIGLDELVDGDHTPEEDAT
jgi:hypothetical protein